MRSRLWVACDHLHLGPASEGPRNPQVKFPLWGCCLDFYQEKHKLAQRVPKKMILLMKTGTRGEKEKERGSKGVKVMIIMMRDAETMYFVSSRHWIPRAANDDALSHFPRQHHHQECAPVMSCRVRGIWRKGWKANEVKERFPSSRMIIQCIMAGDNERLAARLAF